MHPKCRHWFCLSQIQLQPFPQTPCGKLIVFNERRNLMALADADLTKTSRSLYIQLAKLFAILMVRINSSANQANVQRNVLRCNLIIHKKNIINIYAFNWIYDLICAELVMAALLRIYIDWIDNCFGINSKIITHILFIRFIFNLKHFTRNVL